VRHREPPVTVPDRERFFALVRAGFATRRKMLRRALAPVLGDDAATVLERAGVDAGARGEQLSLEQWAAIARAADGRQ
jgi:16S rRNA (adenine1518-N6/adenine1519-N6)-dimethyltransferase